MEQLAQLAHTVKALFPLSLSGKQMNSRDLGRLVPTPALRYRADVVCRYNPLSAAQDHPSTNRLILRYTDYGKTVLLTVSDNFQAMTVLKKTKLVK